MAVDWLEALLLGLVQGLTEWLPVSSSGHLAVVQHMLGREVPVLVDILLHFGTVIVLIAYFRKEIRDVVRAAGALLHDVRKGMSFRKALKKSGERRLAWYIVVGSIPTALLGFMLDWMFGPDIFSNLVVVFVGFGLSGIVLGASALSVHRRKARFDEAEHERERRQRIREGRADPDAWDASGFRRMRAGDAILVGAAQGLAVLPGLSRSGMTISTGIIAGLDSETAGRYSFLLSIPAVLGALAFKLKDASGIASDQLMMAAAGMLVAMLVGYLSLGLLMRILKRKALHWFAPYCFVMAAIVWFMGKGLI